MRLLIVIVFLRLHLDYKEKGINSYLEKRKEGGLPTSDLKTSKIEILKKFHYPKKTKTKIHIK